MCSAGGSCARHSIACMEDCGCMESEVELQLAETSLRRCPTLTDCLTYPDDTQASNCVEC